MDSEVPACCCRCVVVPPDEPWLATVRARLRSIRAPESLRARIAAMLAVERKLGA